MQLESLTGSLLQYCAEVVSLRISDEIVQIRIIIDWRMGANMPVGRKQMLDGISDHHHGPPRPGHTLQPWINFVVSRDKIGSFRVVRDSRPREIFRSRLHVGCARERLEVACQGRSTGLSDVEEQQRRRARITGHGAFKALALSRCREDLHQVRQPLFSIASDDISESWPSVVSADEVATAIAHPLTEDRLKAVCR